MLHVPLVLPQRAIVVGCLPARNCVKNPCLLKFILLTY